MDKIFITNDIKLAKYAEESDIERIMVDLEVLGKEEKNFWKDNKGAKINSIKTRKSIIDSDIVVVKFGDKYKQWNAAFDTGYAAALNKSIIVIHNEEHQHALKEVDAAAAAVAKDQTQVVRILKYILEGSLK